MNGTSWNGTSTFCEKKSQHGPIFRQISSQASCTSTILVPGASPESAGGCAKSKWPVVDSDLWKMCIYMYQQISIHLLMFRPPFCDMGMYWRVIIRTRWNMVKQGQVEMQPLWLPKPPDVPGNLEKYPSETWLRRHPCFLANKIPSHALEKACNFILSTLQSSQSSINRDSIAFPIRRTHGSCWWNVIKPAQQRFGKATTISQHGSLQWTFTATIM